MRLANLHALILLCGFVVAILVANLTSALAGTPPAVGVFVLLAAINIFVVRPRAWAWLWRRAFVRLSHAIVGQDVERALELADGLAAQATTRGTREFLVANRGIALVMGEQWKSGIAVLRGVDRGLLSPLARLIVDNDLRLGPQPRGRPRRGDRAGPRHRRGCARRHDARAGVPRLLHRHARRRARARQHARARPGPPA